MLWYMWNSVKPSKWSRVLWRKSWHILINSFLERFVLDCVRLRWDPYLPLFHMRRLRCGQSPKRLKMRHETLMFWRLQKGRLQGKPRLSRYPLAKFKKQWRPFSAMISANLHILDIFGLWTPSITTLTFQRMHTAYVCIRHRVCLCVSAPLDVLEALAIVHLCFMWISMFSWFPNMGDLSWV